MQFTSLIFFAFLLITLSAYYILPRKFRNHVLLISSCLFYLSFGLKHLIVLACITILGYIFSSIIDKEKNKTFYLWVSIFSLLGVLFYFKYYEYVQLITRDFFALPLLDILLPLGISFYTFQIIGSLIDISRGKSGHEKNFLIYALSISFFPKAVSGPIERSAFSREFKDNKNATYEDVTSGLTLMLIGYFKKIVIADRLAIIVNQIFGNIELYQGVPLILAGLFYMFQLYADFSGYTDIARGIAKLFGIELRINFNRPFLARNVSEFWRRWHISLSTWFLDYAFNPLYLRISKFLTFKTSVKHILTFVISILIVETLLGIWHGANLTFALFGLYFGFMISIYYIIKKQYDKLPGLLQIGINFVVLIVGMIIFRSQNITEAGYIFSNILDISLNFDGIHLNVSWIGLILNIFFMLGLMVYEIMAEFYGFEFSKMNENLRTLCYVILLLMIVLFGPFSQVNFLYSQF